MKLLKIHFTGTRRHWRSIPLTGETEEVARTVGPREETVLIESDAPIYVENALLQFDHQMAFHDAAYERTSHEVVGSLYAIYRQPLRMFSKL